VSKLPQFFIDKENISNGVVRITGSDSYHLSRVRRVKPGSTILLRDEEGMGYSARVTEVTSDEIKAEITDEFSRGSTIPDISLYMALLKGGNFEFVIQKAVEIGVNRMIPVVTERTVPDPEKMSGKKIDRWNKISDEACKQCLRSTPVLIEPPLRFKEVLGEDVTEPRLICHPGADLQLKQALKDFTSRQSVSVLVGPEGGFSAGEITEARNAGWSAVNLGVNHLRAETAALIIPAVIIYEWS